MTNGQDDTIAPGRIRRILSRIRSSGTPLLRPGRDGYWKSGASSYADLFRDAKFGDTPYAQALVPEILEIVSNIATPGATILDAGCGEGFLARLVQRAGYAIEGFDLSPDLIREARRLSPDIRYWVADITATPRKTYDITLCTLVLNNVRQLDDAARALSASVNRQGHLVVALPHPGYYHKLTSTWFFPGQRLPLKLWDYLTETSFVRSLGSAVTSRYFHRTLETYIRTFVGAGLVLTDLREPLPRHVHTAWLKNAAKIPYYIIFVFRKHPSVRKKGPDGAMHD